MSLFDTLTAILHAADPEGTVVPFLLPGVTDGRFFAQLGIQTYGFLAGQVPDDFNVTQVVHVADERIPVSALAIGTEALYRLLQTF
jgi:acetylornithine deacetylase/succinyl-diaminopimelate desuccinylase-like protein